jgi:glycosyltransferase involved in cell wall biosynthesis
VTRRIAMISDHASPLATLGGVDAGGQNVYVAQVARHLAAVGARVDVFTRREDPDVAETVELAPNVNVIHVPAGPPEPIAKERLLPFMPAFTRWMVDRLGQRRDYDLAHANFFYSGLVAAELKAALNLPYVVTFHALGRIRRQFHGAADAFPDERFAIEDRIVADADRILAECPQDEEDLIRLYNADPSRITIVPCGFDPAEFEPMSRPLARLDLGLDPTERILLQLGRPPALRPRAPCPSPRRRRFRAGAGSRGVAGAEAPPFDRVRGGRRRSRAVRRAARPRGAGPVLQRRGHLRLDALVRAVRHHAGRGDGVRDPGGRLAGRRDQVLRP